MLENGVFTELDHPRLGKIATVNNPINVNGVVKQTPAMAPEVGEHSMEILRSIGYAEEEIQEMAHRGVTMTPREDVEADQ
jgi:formyl-CoA transferase